VRITRLVAGGLIAAALCSSTSTTASTFETFNETFSPSWLADFLNDPRTDKLNSFAVHPDTYAPMFLDGLALLNEFPAPNAPEPCTGYSAQEAIVTTAVQAHVECFAGTGGTVTAEFTVEMWVAFAA
jgi:hypothetical protein